MAQTPSKSTTTTQNKEKNSPKSAYEIEQDLAQTRGAISEDIRTLSDRLNPSNLKEEAKTAVKDAASGMKQAAVSKAEDAKDAVMEKVSEVQSVVAEKAVEVKDAVAEKAVELKDEAAEKLSEAKDAVVETLEDASEQAKRFGSEAWRYTSANAVPLAMIGIGAGWLIANSRSSPRRLAADYEYAEYEVEVDEYPVRAARPAARRTNGGGERKRGPDQRAGAKRIAAQAGEAARNAQHKLEDEAARGAQAVRRGVAESGELLRDTFGRAKTATRSFAEENPLALAMATLAAGIGVGLLLPATQPERKLLAPARQKLESWAGDAREAASDVAKVARETVQETMHH